MAETLVGWPFGIFVFLWLKSLNRRIEFIKCDSEGCCTVVQ